jgi:O-glycosyl hydrolase
MAATREPLMRAPLVPVRPAGLVAAVVVLVAALASLRGVPDAAGLTARATVTVDAAKHYQRIDGFGVSGGFGQAKALMKASASVRKQVLSLLYSPTRGVLP